MNYSFKRRFRFFAIVLILLAIGGATLVMLTNGDNSRSAWKHGR
jgi:hypothetical protein